MPDVPLDRVGRFLRRLTHDLRNGLNAADLQASLLAELIQEPEPSEELQRLRSILRDNARKLAELSAVFAPFQVDATRVPISALVDELKTRARQQYGDQTITWPPPTLERGVEGDFALLLWVFLELLSNAIRFREPGGSIALRVNQAASGVQFELSEQKRSLEGDPAGWGIEPFRFGPDGGLGLGLFRARRIIQAHGGTWDARYDPDQKLLITQILLPFAGSER